MKYLFILMALMMIQSKFRVLDSGEDEKSEEQENEEKDSQENEDDNKREETQDENEETEEVPNCILNSGYRNEKSILCSNASKESCCSKTSEKIILNVWNNNNKIRIKQYIEGYIWLFKMILNYYEDYIEKANEIKLFPSAPTECKKSADELISKFVDPADIENYLLRLEKMYQHIAFSRKSLYCVMCTTDTQGFINIEDKTVQFANKFCQNLVESTLQEIYDRTNIYMQIFNHMNQIADCNPEKPYVPDVYQIDMFPPQEQDMVMQKCYKVYKEDPDPRVYMPGCLDFCKEYSLTNAKEIIEGSVGKLLFLFNKIKNIDDQPTNPIFNDFETDVLFDFSFVGPRFFENQFTPVYDDDGLELFFISAKSNLQYSHNESDVNIFKTLGWMMSLWFFWN